MNYYNENEPFAVQWLKNLIDARLIPAGHVDDRSIKDVTANDLRGYRQWHFFAGIGGWSEALRIAGWPSDVPVCTGSCPCQPLSCAGKHEGEMDERHLWPEFYRIIAELRPPVIFGEQVASADGLEWFDGVSLDLEELDYAIGASDLPAASAGAPHIRQRIFWMADATGIMGNGGKHQPQRQAEGRAANRRDRARLEHAKSDGRQQRRPESNWWGTASRCGTDGIRRRIEPGLEPLAARLPQRVDMLRGFGNAIVPQVAAEFIRAYLEC